jgi:phage terminase small subunit
MAKLTDKQQLFVLHYVQCWNASEAARRAGYGAKANVIGAQNLAKLSIQA